jgi:hypothetical protein
MTIHQLLAHLGLKRQERPRDVLRSHKLTERSLGGSTCTDSGLRTGRNRAGRRGTRRTHAVETSISPGLELAGPTLAGGEPSGPGAGTGPSRSLRSHREKCRACLRTGPLLAVAGSHGRGSRTPKGSCTRAHAGYNVGSGSRPRRLHSRVADPYHYRARSCALARLEVVFIVSHVLSRPRAVPVSLHP